MFSRKSFTLTELLIAVVLTGVVILAVVSVDITSRQFFFTASREVRIQDEAKIAMEHIVKYTQRGIGDMTNPITLPGFPPDHTNDSRGFFILDDSGKLVADGKPGSQIQVKIDGLRTGVVDGRFDYPGPGNDGIIQYTFQSGNHRIIYDPDIDSPGDESLAGDIVFAATFTAADAPHHNQVKVNITVRRVPTDDPGPENPETTLTSDIVLRAMSTN